MVKIIALLVIVVGMFSWLTTRNGKTPRDLTRPVFETTYDLIDLGNPGNPNYDLSRIYRKDRRTAIRAMVAQKEQEAAKNPIKNPLATDGTTPEAFYERHSRSAELAWGFQNAEEKLGDDMTGLHLRTMGDLSIYPNKEWKSLGEKVHKGDRIWVGGTVQNKILNSIRRNQIEIGPDGIDLEEIDANKPYDHRYPMYAALGRVNGLPFLIGSEAISPYTGMLEVRTNNPYWSTIHEGLGGTNNQGIGEFTILRIRRNE
jgi:hypothetical protein